MITGIIAEMGAGKTLLMTRRLQRRYQRGFKVLTNYKVNFPHEKINRDKILRLGPDLQHTVIGLTEIHVWFDSYDSMSAINKTASYFATQTRKRDVYLFYDSQDEMQVPKRIRKNTDRWVYCERVGKHTFEYVVYDKRGNQLGPPKRYDGRPHYNLYDTRETITLLDNEIPAPTKKWH